MINYSLLALAAPLLGILISPTAAQAAVVRGSLSGVVTEIDATDTDGLSDGAAFQSILPFSIGDTLVASFDYESSAGLVVTGPNGEVVSGRLEVRVNGIALTAADGFRILVRDGTQGVVDVISISPNTVPDYFAEGWRHEFTTLSSLSGMGGGYGVVLSDETGQVFSNGVVDNRVLDVSDFDSRHFSMQTIVHSDAVSTWTSPQGLKHSGNLQRVRGIFTSLTIETVPEPSAILYVIALALSPLGTRSLRAT